ncbi:MAG: hypothetical protein GX271_07640 [Clostridiales bacterium]|nr:hypothetical protein [Clostridiales bacterium]
MKHEINNKIEVYESIAIKVLHYFIKDKEITSIDYLKCKLGLETLLINISKLFVIYLLSFSFNILWPTMVFHFFHMVVRLKGYGAHCKSSFICTCVSSIIFVAVPYIIVNHYQFSNVVLLFLYVSGFLILYRYASIGTAKNLVHKERQATLKKMTLISYLLSGIVSMFIKSEIYLNLIVIGLFSACVLTLPILTKSNKTRNIVF